MKFLIEDKLPGQVDIFTLEKEMKAQDLYDKITDKNDIESWFKVLVPQSGPADTLAGELIRAMMRILYRDFNDGDRFFSGYGLETCGGSAQFLIENTNNEIATALKKIAENNLESDEYTEAIEDVSTRLLRYLNNNKGLIGTENTDDSTEWEISEDLIPVYDFDCELPRQLYDIIRYTDYSEEDLEQEIYYWEANGEQIGGAVERIAVDGYMLYIEGIQEDLYNELNREMYEWLEDFADELSKEYPIENEEDREDDLDEALEPREKVPETKKKKALGAFVKLDAGNVEEGNKFFNKAVAGTESEGGCNMSEEKLTKAKADARPDKNYKLKKHLKEEFDWSDMDSFDNPLVDVWNEALDLLEVEPEGSIEGGEGSTQYRDSTTGDILYDVDYSTEVDFMNNLYKDIDFNLLESDKKYRKIIIDNIADFITDYPYDDEYIEEDLTNSEDKTDSVSEDLKTINIRDELNKLDTIDYNDLVNMYDCLKLSDPEKTQLAQLLSNHDNENVIKFISDRYYKENICEDNNNTAEQDIEVSVSLGNRIKQIYDADAEQADIQHENKNYKAWDAFDKKWELLHLLLVQYDRHNRRPLEKVIDRMRPEDQKQLIDRYLKENLQEQNFDDNMPEWLSRRDRLSKRLSEINQERAEIEKTIDYQQDHNYSMIDFDLMDRLDELNMEAEIINKKLEEI